MKFRPTPHVTKSSKQPAPATPECSAGSSHKGTVEVDHAVFTSVRSPTGEGYRIIAASSGLRPKERSEITRRCPSHGGLCRNAKDSTGLMGWPMPLDRYAIAYSTYAGTEHTARGGQRVWTNVVVLDGVAYRRFACNPLLVLSAMQPLIEPMIGEKPDAALKPLALTLPTLLDRRVTPSASSLKDGNTEQLSRLLEHVFADRAMVVAGAESGLTVLETILTALPVYLREKLSFSSGVKHSPGRHIRMALVDADDGETQRKLRGHQIAWFDIERIPRADVCPQRGWITLVQRWWNAKRHAEVCRTANRIVEPIADGTLNWIATIWTDLDQVMGADSETLNDLEAKYRGFMADTALERELVDRLLTQLELERQHLEEAEQAQSEPSAASDPVVHHVSSPSE